MRTHVRAERLEIQRRATQAVHRDNDRARPTAIHGFPPRVGKRLAIVCNPRVLRAGGRHAAALKQENRTTPRPGKQKNMKSGNLKASGDLPSPFHYFLFSCRSASAFKAPA
jgi:hypothetical protein